MAFFDEFQPRPMSLPSVASVTETLRGLFETPFARRNRMISEQIRELRSLSDDQLSKRGLTRDDIIPHVFGRTS